MVFHLVLFQITLIDYKSLDPVTMLGGNIGSNMKELVHKYKNIYMSLRSQ